MNRSHVTDRRQDRRDAQATVLAAAAARRASLLNLRAFLDSTPAPTPIALA